MTINVNKETARLIKYNRLKAGLSQKKLAKLCGWTQQNQSLLEKGLNNITVIQIYIIALAMGIPVTAFLPAMNGQVSD